MNIVSLKPLQTPLRPLVSMVPYTEQQEATDNNMLQK